MTLELIPLYKIISLGFSYPEHSHWDMIESQYSLAEEFLSGDLLTSLNRFMDSFYANQHCMDDIRSDYLRLFDVGREISPYETEYVKEKASRKPFELSDITGFYSAFGFGVGTDMQFKEAPDHVSIELEFMAILSWKEAFAREEKQAEHLGIVQDARFKFFESHVAKWSFYFCRKVLDLDEDDFFKLLSKLFRLVLITECKKYGMDVSLYDKTLDRDPYKGVRDEQLIC